MADRRRIGHEIAAADHKGGKRGYPSTLIATARELERELGKRRKLRRELRTAEKRIRQLRKELKALAGAEQGDEL